MLNKLLQLVYSFFSSTDQQQLALYNPSAQPLLVYPNNQQSFEAQPHSNIKPVDESSTKQILAKLELVNEKLDSIKSSNSQLAVSQQQNMPNMETSVLLQNIQRIVRENDQYKQELYEKSAKIEEQNGKITQLLLKAQSYVEQSHLMLEQKNNSLQSSAEKSVTKVLELEQDKMRLTSELSELTAKISQLNLDIHKMQKSDFELRQQLAEISKNTDSYKQNSERLLVENADLQAKLDTCLSELKKVSVTYELF